MAVRRQEKRAALAVKKQELEQLMKAGRENRLTDIITFLAQGDLGLLIPYDRELQIIYKMGQICELEKGYKEQCMLLDFAFNIKEATDLYSDLRNICLRIENNIPEELWPTDIDGEKMQLSGVTFFKIIEEETEQKEKNINTLARMLRQKGMLIAAIRLLQLGLEKYKEEGLALELADCWISCGRPKLAYEALNQLKRPSEGVREIKQELERMTGNENI